MKKLPAVSRQDFGLATGRLLKKPISPGDQKCLDARRPQTEE
jgi:hypothetical protein